MLRMLLKLFLLKDFLISPEGALESIDNLITIMLDNAKNKTRMEKK